MKGHKTALCQLRSPSEDSFGQNRFDQGSFSGSIHEDDEEGDCGHAVSAQRVASSHAPVISSGPYPRHPITPELSWSPPPPGVPYYRRNPQAMVVNHHLNVASPIRRTNSWISTVVGDDDTNEVEDISTPTSSFSFSSRGAVQPLQRKYAAIGPAANQDPVILDTAGNRVFGFDLSTIGDNLKGILREAEAAGLMSAIVRPRVGYRRGDLNIRDEADADKHTSVYVATGQDTLAINMMPASINKGVGSNSGVRSITTYAIVFVVVFLAALLGSGASKYISDILGQYRFGY